MKRSPGAVGLELEPLLGVFRLLSDKTRLTILLLLADGERNVSSLCETLALPQPTVSHHLGLLRMQNLITNRRDGKQVYYELNGHVNSTEGEVLQIMVDQFALRVAERQDAPVS